ncbi:hypothetical protein K6119_03115 [Paracrocinitomix mangrovi]|uniref:hypothetical protein n=1 Tax=Paracrocinitomix mangrovi TaxID=2862509 RepID=UPI001C8EEED6|nr:hypothetical protein [Paracrocinitomix mangrovi]UKN02510.1 hypothetical protein K6119_03115 [Paracrocinitomix mangrovi]
MKKLFTLLLVFTITSVFAQPPGKEERKEKIKAQKIAFISTELDLTPSEAEKFWPVYNEMDAEMEKLEKEKRQHLKKMRTFDELTEDEAYEMTQKIFEIESKQNDLRIKYLAKFAEVIGKKKAAKVYMAEERFKRELLDRIRQHQENKQHGPPPGGR